MSGLPDFQIIDYSKDLSEVILYIECSCYLACRLSVIGTNIEIDEVCLISSKSISLRKYLSTNALVDCLCEYFFPLLEAILSPFLLRTRIEITSSPLSIWYLSI